MSEDLREKSTGRRDRVLPDRPRLVLASFLMLFVELALIRWTAANDLYLAHLTNFVLLASFLGIGIGFLLRRGRARPLPVRPARAGGAGRLPPRVPGRRPWTARDGVAARRGARHARAAPLGEPGGDLPAHRRGARRVSARRSPARSAGSRPLEAYRLDVLGSLAGIVLFAGRVLPPAAAAGLGRDRRGRVRAAARPPPAAPGGRGRGGAGRPAARRAVAARRRLLVAVLQDPGGDRPPDGSVKVDVNNTPAPDRAPAGASWTTPTRSTATPTPTRARRDDVLIIGAGTGNDVAVALAEGAKRVDAVEIDPVLQQLGKDRHPERPYADPQGDRARRRRSGVPGADRPPLRPDPAGPARLGHDRDRAGGAAAGELPVHHRGADAGAVAAQAGRHVRDVQLLRAVAASTATPTRSQAVYGAPPCVQRRPVDRRRARRRC